MILELEDIREQEVVTIHFDLPGGITLGELVKHDPRISEACLDSAVQTRFNGVVISDWHNLSPARGDTVRILVAPKDPVSVGIAVANIAISAGASAATAAAIGGAVAIAMTAAAILSAVMFVVSLFNRPKTSSGGRGDSPTYSFEGIHTLIVPGGVVPIVYGQHRVGGQLLSMAVDVSSSGLKQELSLLIGLGEGDITEVSCVRVNGVAIENISSVQTDFRLGTTSQAILPGFEFDRNTFADGREIASGTPITYATVGTSVVAFTAHIAAFQGLIHYKTDGGRESTWVDFGIERRPTGTTTFTVIASPVRFTGKTGAPISTTFTSSFPTAGDWDIRASFVAARQEKVVVEGSRTRGRLWLSNVTEYEGAGEPYSGTALLAIKALATSDLHGGRPDVSAVVRGKPCLVYSTTAVSTRTWTQIPAWHVLDYMTNSIYGMGPFISPVDINLQSFIDFATLCQSQVPDGKGGTEDQFHLDLVMDVKKSHWQWVQDMLAPYRSAVIYSQEQWKIITDRADLPLRQVFHSGNIMPQETQVVIGGDPMRPNQVTVQFANQALDYEQDVRYLQDSASILGAGNAIKDYSISLTGVARESEALRNGYFDLQRRLQTKKEISFSTALEALAVEPGDMVRVGVITTDYEAGYGGRALDGSSSHIVLDREVNVQSGYTYDLFVWHLQADTIESVTVRSMTGVTITVTPTWVGSVLFNNAVMPGDRWSIGINSEDLMLAQVKKITRSSGGLHRIVADQYIAMAPNTPSLNRRLTTKEAPPILQEPAQPAGVYLDEEKNILKDGTMISKIFVDIAPALLVEGGRITSPGTTASVTLAQSHNPNVGALQGETLSFLSGPASGTSRLIVGWGGSATRVATVAPTFVAAPNSGDPYNLHKKGGQITGFDVLLQTGSGDDFAYQGSYPGLGAEFSAEAQAGDNFNFRIAPYGIDGKRNTQGMWTVSLTTYGDTIAPNTPSGLTAAQDVGKSILVDWNDNPDVDLSHYALYRSTGNSFGGASLLAEMNTSRFTDVGSDFEIPYYYWVQAVDASSNVSPVHPASNAGVTLSSSRILTSDVGSNQVTQQANVVGTNVVTLAAGLNFAETGVSCLTVTANNGDILLFARFGAGLQIAVGSVVGGETVGLDTRFRVGSLGGAQIDDASFNNLVTLSTSIRSPLFAGLHSPGSSTITYILTVQGSSNINYGNIVTFGRRIQALEVKR